MIKKEELILGRDRLGVKPLYIYQNNNEIFFSSEIKSFLHVDSFKKTLNNQSIHNYLKYNYIPVPQTIFENVRHVLPGSYLQINTKTFNIKTTKYWDISNTKELDNVSEEDVFDKIDEILEDAIKIRLRSDVGIGAFLSGGLDSSLVCAVTKEKFNIGLDSYTIGFKEKKYDESDWAKKVANFCNFKTKFTF